MKHKLMYTLFISITLQYNILSNVAIKSDRCDSCNVKIEELRKENTQLEALCRHYREEVAKWMKLYYDGQEKILDIARQAAKSISELTTKILQLQDKYSGRK